jgi:hypothetical protein
LQLPELNFKAMPARWFALLAASGLLLSGCAVLNAISGAHRAASALASRDLKLTTRISAPEPAMVDATPGPSQVYRIGSTWPGCFLIETTTNLVDWTPWGSDLVTNDFSEPRRFFRTRPVLCTRANPVFADDYFNALPSLPETTFTPLQSP